MNVRTKFFPIPIVNQFMLMILAALVGSGAYGLLTDWFYEDYKEALKEAQVIENILSTHGESAVTSEERFDFIEHLTPRDFSILFIEAGIEKEKDLVKSQDILDVTKNGPGAWMINKILSTSSQAGTPLHKLFLSNPSVDLANCKAPNKVGTLTAMLAAFSELGLNSKSGEETQADPCNVFKPSIHTEAESLVNILAGKPPRWIPFMDDPDDFQLQNVIKDQMQSKWRIYNGSNIDADTDISTYKYTGSGYELTVNDGVTKTLADTKWFKNDKNASELNKGIFDLANLLINEVLRDGNVRFERFFYKALKGPIQWGLFVFIFYIFFMLMWRWIAAISRVKTGKMNILHVKPKIVQGKVLDIDRNMAASRTLIDQLISVCPLLGLFGTVTGIMLGLPEAAGVVMGGSSDVSSLFEQLGLAFSTTAIAVAGVIILESVWEQLQSYEDHQIWHLSENGNS